MKKSVKKCLASTFLLIYLVHVAQNFMIFVVILIDFADIDWCKVLKTVHNCNYDYNVMAFKISVTAIATRFICIFLQYQLSWQNFNYDYNLKP